MFRNIFRQKGFVRKRKIAAAKISGSRIGLSLGSRSKRNIFVQPLITCACHDKTGKHENEAIGGKNQVRRKKTDTDWSAIRSVGSRRSARSSYNFDLAEVAKAMHCVSGLPEESWRKTGGFWSNVAVKVGIADNELIRKSLYMMWKANRGGIRRVFEDYRSQKLVDKKQQHIESDFGITDGEKMTKKVQQPTQQKASKRTRHIPKVFTPDDGKKKVYCLCQEEDNGFYLVCDSKQNGCLEYYHPACVGLKEIQSREVAVKYSNCSDGMSYMTDLTEAARLLTQAATSLINSPLLHNGQNSQTGQTLTSSETSRSVPTAVTVQSGQDTSRPARARDEFRRLFASYSHPSTSRSGSSTSSQRRTASNTQARAKKRKTVKDVTIKFFCLASTTQHDVPSNEEKQQLLVAGLGEKKVTLPGEGSANDVRVGLKETFPKLNDSGGYEFMHAKPGSRELNVIREGQNSYTVDFLKRFVGQGRVYVRPIQRDLDLNPETAKNEHGEVVEEICNYCFNIFPMNQLREHIYVCPGKRKDDTGKRKEDTTVTLAREESNQHEVINLEEDETQETKPQCSNPEEISQSTDVISRENTDFDMMYASLIFEDINADQFSDEQVDEDEEKPPETVTSTDVLDIKDILEEIATVNIDSENISKFNICRSNIWDGVLRGMERKSFSPNKKVSVKFTDDVGLSEGAVDLGGPMREFFTLALEKVLSGKLFCGQEHQKFLSHDAQALKQGEYFKAGQLFTMALVHCGIGPRCLSPILFDSLVKGPGEVVVPIDSVYDPELQLGLQRLMSVQSVDDANKVIADEKLQGILELSGTLRFMKSVCDVKEVASETAHWYVLGRTRAAFESFKNGLNCLGLLDALLHNPDSFYQTMCFHSQVLSSDIFEKLFTFSRSEELSNRWELENRIIAFWRDLLLDVEEKESEITFSDILFFASGLKFVPSRGICLELEFLHDPEANGQLSNFPKSNTCSCVLYLSVTHFKYVDFKGAFTFAIRNAKGFGNR